jgi:uncharacterized alpha-E superfamily protein
MLSRVADSLYWMSRYLERAEHSIRLLEVNMGLMLDKSETSAEGRWKRVLRSLGNPKDIQWEGDYHRVVDALAFDSDNPASIASCILQARENARQVRDEISTEQWQRLNNLYHEISGPRQINSYFTEFIDFLLKLLGDLHLFQGVTDSTMSHGEGWHFIQMGRYIERASSTATLLDGYRHETFTVSEDLNDGYQYLEWIGLLRCCAAFEAYCRVYTAELSQDRILDFLLLNRQFPHSIRYSIDCLQQALTAIQQESGRQPTDELTRIAGRLQSSLTFVDISSILSQDPGRYLQGIYQQCRQIHKLIYRYYIDYSIQTALAI